MFAFGYGHQFIYTLGIKTSLQFFHEIEFFGEKLSHFSITSHPNFFIMNQKLLAKNRRGPQDLGQ